MSFQVPSELSDVAFGNPAWLQALWLLVLVPLLYLMRRRVTRFLVPHLPLWEKILDRPRRHRPRLLRTLISILLQVAILLSVILLLADPFEVTEEPETGHTVVLLDHSLGTRMTDKDGVALSERVLRKGRALAVRAASEGTVAVALVSDGLTPVMTALSGNMAVSEAFDRLVAGLPLPSGDREPRGLTGVLPPLVEGDGGRERRVLVTPFAPSAAAAAAYTTSGVTVTGVGAIPADGGVERVTFDRTTGRLRVGLSGANGRRLTLLSGGESVVEAAVSSDEVALDVPAGMSGEMTLALEPADHYPLNDRIPLLLPGRRGFSVLVASDSKTPNLDGFLASSLNIDIARSGRADHGAFRGIASDYDVTILVGIDEATPLSSGRWLLLGSYAPDLGLARGDASPAATEATDIDASDPLVRALDLSLLRVASMAPLRASAQVDVVVNSPLGPLISRGGHDGVRFIHFAANPEGNRTTFARMEAFPLFLDEAISELAAKDDIADVVVYRARSSLRLLPFERPEFLAEDGVTWPLSMLNDGTGVELPDWSGRGHLAGSERARALAVGWQGHPGSPGPGLAEEGAFLPFPLRKSSRPLRQELLWVLLLLLALEWLSYGLLTTD